MSSPPHGPADADRASALDDLDQLDDGATARHLAVYTAIAGELAARLDDPQIDRHADRGVRDGDRG